MVKNRLNKTNKSIKWLPLYMLGLFIFLSCSDSDTEYNYTPGQKTVAVYLDPDQGTQSISITSNGSWSVKLDDATVKWAKIEGSNSGSGNGSVQLFYTQNASFRRMGKMLFTVADSDVPDTLLIKQFGKTAVIDIQKKEAVATVFGGDDVVDLYTNLPASIRKNVKAEVEYLGDQKDWVKNLKIATDFSKLSFSILANSSEARTANIQLVYVDDWNEKITSTCQLVQAKKGGTGQTKEKTFAEIRALINTPTGSLKINDDIKLVGVVSSDCDNPNIGDNPQIDIKSIDFQENYRTAYVQSADGSLGFMLKFTNSEDNILKRYDNLNLWLKGATLVKETNPVRYSITNLSAEHYVSVASGRIADLPPKDRFIGDLTDNDVYTYVKLKECEFPIRKGSYTPINEGYAISYGQAKVDKYPLLIRDSKGAASYMLTNMNCTYRRDGSVVPQGSGSITGVIVSEKYERFELGGDIGKYQIRHLTREDIAVDASPDNSFSKILCEWNRYVSTGTSIAATSGSGTLTHSTGGSISASLDHSYLGPIVADESIDRKGAVSNAALSATSWWNGGKGESWIVKFSTAGKTGTQLSLQLATYSSVIGAPKYWVVETSTHGNMNGAWDAAGEYTVPDIVYWDLTQYYQLCGWKNINVALPANLLGKSDVYVRLRVSNSKAGTQTSYDGGSIVSGSRNVLVYLSVRYN